MNSYGVRDLARGVEIANGHMVWVGPDTLFGSYTAGPLVYLFNAGLVGLGLNLEQVFIVYLALTFGSLMLLSAILSSWLGAPIALCSLTLLASANLMGSVEFMNNSALILPWFTALIACFYFYFRQNLKSSGLTTPQTLGGFLLIGMGCHIHLSFLTLTPLWAAIVAGEQAGFFKWFKIVALALCALLISFTPHLIAWLGFTHFKTWDGPAFFANSHEDAFGFENLYNANVFQVTRVTEKIRAYRIEMLTLFLLILGMQYGFQRERHQNHWLSKRVGHWLLAFGLAGIPLNLISNNARYILIWFCVGLGYLFFSFGSAKRTRVWFSSGPLKILVISALLIIASAHAFLSKPASAFRVQYSLRDLLSICEIFNDKSISFGDLTLSSYELLEPEADSSFRYAEFCFKKKQRTLAEGAPAHYYFFLQKSLLKPDQSAKDFLSDKINPVMPESLLAKDFTLMGQTPRVMVFQSVNLAPLSRIRPTGSLDAYKFDLGIGFQRNLARWDELSSFFGNAEDPKIWRADLCPHVPYCSVFLIVPNAIGPLKMVLFSRLFQWSKDPPLSGWIEDPSIDMNCANRKLSLSLGKHLGFQDLESISVSRYSPVWINDPGRCDAPLSIELRFSKLKIERIYYQREILKSGGGHIEFKRVQGPGFYF